ncbi:MAG TPA: M23 family metallopeptidase [Rhizomicrobium sp.]|nr:M23 family metallopeptidase [Rhizomicrobium sp.]
MNRRNVTTFESFLTQWRRATSGAAVALATTDGRWAVVSTSVTALIAGAIAWLAVGTMPPATSHGFGTTADRSLMPYQLFLRLAAQAKPGDANYASFAPGTSGATAAPPAPQMAAPLDNALAAEENGDDSNPNQGVDAHTITLDSGDTLAGVLTDSGATSADAQAAIAALAKVYDPRQVRAGQSLQVTFEAVKETHTTAQITYTPPANAGGDDAVSDVDGSDDSGLQPAAGAPVGRLLSVSFSPTIGQDISITRDTNGGFSASAQQQTLAAHYHHAGATIDSSLYLAAMQAGIPAKVVVEMIHMLSYKVDFQRDIRPGDSFQVLYSYYYTPSGQAAKEGDIDYVTMKLADRTVTLYRYQPKGDTVDYFDSKGESAKGMLMKTPVDGARITSGFGMRFHPILGYTRMHKGIDFGVPLGTPVMAAGAGTVEESGWKGGYGNFLLLNHGNSYETAYGHLSRFAPGIHPGSRVRQGQVVAYSGSTGESTGPHLHYEIRINKQQVNPLLVKVATGRRLAGHDLRTFLNSRIHVDLELASMPLEGKVADSAATDLRAAKD